jgi:hypothetical protein
VRGAEAATSAVRNVIYPAKAYGLKRGSLCLWEPVTVCDRFRIRRLAACQLKGAALLLCLCLCLCLFLLAIELDPN